MGMIRRELFWLMAGCCVALAFAAGAYRLGHNHGWLDAEAVGFQAGFDAAQEKARQQTAEAFTRGYTLGKLVGIVTPRRQEAAASGTSCITCHAGRYSPPSERVEPDRPTSPLLLNLTIKPLVWQTND